MKDRTFIVLAVLFLMFSIGGGVNKSLQAGNSTMGKPMAPDLKQLYNRNITVLAGRFREINEFHKQKTRQVFYAKYPEIKNKVEVWQAKFLNTYAMLKNKAQDKKNIIKQ